MGLLLCGKEHISQAARPGSLRKVQCAHVHIAPELPPLTGGWDAAPLPVYDVCCDDIGDGAGKKKKKEREVKITRIFSSPLADMGVGGRITNTFSSPRQYAAWAGVKPGLICPILYLYIPMGWCFIH